MRPRKTEPDEAAETASPVLKARFVSPMAARVVDKLPDGDEWLYEVKFDGYDGRQLRFAGKVRAGFTPRLRREVAAELKPFHVDRCPFVDLPHTTTSRWGGGVTPEQMAEIQWVRPVPVAQVRFVEWPAGGHLRHSAFLGLRKDKRARAVEREKG